MAAMKISALGAALFGAGIGTALSRHPRNHFELRRGEKGKLSFHVLTLSK